MSGRSHPQFAGMPVPSYEHDALFAANKSSHLRHDLWQPISVYNFTTDLLERLADLLELANCGRYLVNKRSSA